MEGMQMGRAAVRRGVLAPVVLVALFGAACPECGLEELGGEDAGKIDMPLECLPQQQTCGTRESFRDGRCQNTYCESNEECCPGTRCDLAFNVCRSRLLDTPCETDADCPKPGQKCEERGQDLLCVFDSCTRDSDCDDGSTCFKGSCVAGNPCDACRSDEVCDVATGTCHPGAGHDGCAVTCSVGQVRALTDPATMSGAVCCAWACECVSLPPLPRGIVGQYASVALTHLEVAVASYDRTYGDLVVTRYDHEQALLKHEYVDGFPATGTVEGDVEGPRNGIKELGEDVGQWASAAVDGLGRLHVAYFDNTNGALKHAVRTAPDSWQIHVVDDEHVAGQFASLAIRASDGIPVISYFVTGMTDAQGRAASGVKLAVARVVDPASSADWESTFLEQGPDFDPCDNSCGPAQACILGGEDGVQCANPSSGCSPACSSGQACVNAGSGASCEPLADPGFADLPHAVGIFTSVAVQDGVPVVAWHDAVKGELHAARVDGMGTPAIVVIDGDGMDGRGMGPAGAHVSVATDLVGKIAMIYVDEGAHELKFFHGSTLDGGSTRVVDTGRGMPPGFHELGAGASLAVGPDGTAYVVYQEQTTLDMRVAQREPDGAWTISEPLTEGPFGFYTDIALGSERAYIASVQPMLDDRLRLANKLGLQTITIPLP